MLEAKHEKPSERFQGDTNLVDLDGVIEVLQADHEPKDGHRQIAVFKHGNLTKAVFLFEPGGEFKEHKAQAYVSILCFKGAVNVVTPDGTLHLSNNQLVVLDPDVLHRLYSEEGGAVLVSINKV